MGPAITIRALLEAAAMVRPLLAVDVPSCREIVREGGKACCPRLARPSRRSTIERRIAAGPEQRYKSATNSRDIAEHEYDERLVIDAYRSAVIALSGKGR